MLGGPLLPCSTCANWAGDGALCASCGARRSGQEPVPLRESPGDERWVLSRRGGAERVLAALDAAAAEAPEPDLARLRVAAARRVLTALKDPEVSVQLDLRRAEAGHLAKSKRRGSNEEQYWVLPWLALEVLSGPHAGLRGTALRVTHVRRRRSFGAAGVEDDATRYSMDELRLEHPSRGRLRRPFRSPTRLAELDLGELSRDAPAPEPAPATAPRSAHAEGAPLLAGGLLTAALSVLLLALALTAPAPPAAPAELHDPTRWRALQAALTSGTPTAPVVRVGLVDASPDRRREALLATQALPPAERRRALRAALHDPDPGVQALAVELSARDGEPGAGLLTAVVAGSVGVAAERRLQALRLLVDRRDPRVTPLAVRGLGGEAPLPLRRAWVQALGARTGPASRAVVASLARTAADPDPQLRAQAGWALAQVAPTRAAQVLQLALAQTLDQLLAAAQPSLDHTRAVVTLTRALVEVEPGRARALLEPILRGERLPRRLARRLRRILR